MSRRKAVTLKFRLLRTRWSGATLAGYLLPVLVAMSVPNIPATAQTDSASVGQLPEEIYQSDWIRVTSRHFELISNHNVRETRELARKLELFRQASEYITGYALPDTIRPVKIFITPDKEIHQYLMAGNAGLSGTVGVFFETLPGNYAVSLATTSAHKVTRKQLADRWARPKPIRDRSVRAQTSLSNLLHEFTHYLAASNPEQIYPLWYSEGYAEYLSSMSFARKGKIQVGLPLAFHLEAIRRLDWLPIEEVLDTKYFQSPRHEYLQSFYAQSWLMTSWFFADPERRNQLYSFIDALTAGTDWREAWAGTIDISFTELDKVLQRYARRPRFASQAIDIAALSTPEEPSQSDVAEEHLMVELGRFFLDARQLPHSAAALFERALGVNGNNIDALHGMSRALTTSDWPQAYALANKALALNPEHVPALTHVAELNRLQITQHEDPEIQHRYLDTAIAQIELALSEDATDVEALYTAGRLYASKRAFDKSSDAFARALEYAPGSVGIQEALISLYFFKGEISAAERVVDKVKRSHHMQAAQLASFESWVESLRLQHRTNRRRQG